MTAEEIRADDLVVRPFADWLREQSTGKTHEELSDAMYDLVARVRDTGKKGSLVLTVTIAPFDKDDSVLLISDEIRLKLPEHHRKASIFYADKTGNVTRRDPNQLDFDSLREVGGMDVDISTGEIKEKHA